MENINVTAIFGTAVVIFGALIVIAKAVAKLTPSKKDDEVLETIDSAIGPIIKKLEEPAPPSKP